MGLSSSSSSTSSEEFSSSSSEDFSSSSSSLTSESSSSGSYCQYPDCTGNACALFTGWFLEGVTSSLTDDGYLYAFFETISTNQVVKIYNNSSRTENSLLAQGQKSSSGTIILLEVNSSGVSGSVTWNGTLAGESYTATLGCLIMSSSSSSTSSSSSSIDSSSTSSTSSSSSACCTNPFCDGPACANFTSWTFSGLRESNSDNCNLYVYFDFIDNSQVQQVFVYKDSARTELVAAGNALDSGTINLYAANSSGLTGSVEWNGQETHYPSSVQLSCEEFSSSSSSSQSSLSSFSSSSSSDLSESSSSSSSTTSSSSDSSLSESSSSSIDSSSSSSESELNVSSSSSSSSSSSDYASRWNQSKPLFTAMAATTGNGILNKIAQTVSLSGSTYDISKVFCYLHKAVGNNAFNIVVGIYDCDDDGVPDSLISSTSISSTTVTQNGWYAFEFNLQDDTPDNGFLAVVLWQDGGNEDNYVLWGFETKDIDDNSIAYYTSNGSSWIEQENVVRSLKITGTFDPYDLVNFRVKSPSATLRNASTTLNNTTSSLIKTSYDGSSISMNHPDLLLSFVIDSSGSMGWNDRLNNRNSFVSQLIDRFKTSYPSDVKFDIIHFGSQTASNNNIFSNSGRILKINLDLNRATRTMYSFAVSGASVSKGDTYVNNDVVYTVVSGTIAGDRIVLSGASDPLDSGILTRSSGVGDVAIEYSSYVKPSIRNEILAYGFKNLENGHTYSVGPIEVDNNVIDSLGDVSNISETNWKLFYDQDEFPTINLGANGPNSDASVDFVASPSLVVRNPFFKGSINEKDIEANTSVGDSLVNIGSGNNFLVDNRIDLTNGLISSVNHAITAISGGNFTLDPSIYFDINKETGIAHTSLLNKGKRLDGTTIMLLVKDANVTQDVTFFIQDETGLAFEYDFRPFSDWVALDLYWLNESAPLFFSLFDVNNNPFPDGSKVVIQVDEPPESSTDNEDIASENFSENVLQGENRIPLSSTSGFSVGMRVDIIDNSNNFQNTVIDEVGDDYVIIRDSLKFDFLVSNGARIVQSEESGSLDSSAKLIPNGISLVDITPIYTNTAPSVSILQTYDLDPLDPSTEYSELNQIVGNIQTGSADIPSVNGNGVIRILPITEDYHKTVEEKQNDLQRIFRLNQSNQIASQLERNEGDLDTFEASQEDEISAITYKTRGDDYLITNPVFLYNGIGEGSMSSFATEFEKKNFAGLSIPSVEGSIELDVKEYTLYPYLTLESENQVELARQFFDPRIIYFAPAFYIHSKVEEKYVEYLCEDTNDCGQFQGYDTTRVLGVYAGSSSIQIEYTITEEFVLKSSGTLFVKIYSNQVADLEGIACVLDQSSNHAINISLPDEFNGEEFVSRETTIEKWRNIARNNPVGQLSSPSAENSQSTSTNISTSGLSGAEQQIVEDAINLYSNLPGQDFSNPDNEEGSYGFYINPLEWTLATQLGELAEQELEIINGKATLVIPKSNIPALLFVEAYVEYGQENRYQSIRNDYIFNSNPINIGSLTPYKFFAEEGKKFEIGTDITWKDGSEGLVADNTLVNFETVTNIEPASTVTNNGFAGGIFIGPHPPVDLLQDEQSLCPPLFPEESVKVTVYHASGFTRTAIRKIVWEGFVEDEISDVQFYFYVSSNNEAAWADGFANPSAQIISDLESPNNLAWIGDDGISRLQGTDQPNNDPRSVDAKASSTDVVATPNRTSWGDTIVNVDISGLNKNIGHPPAIEDGEELPSPWSIPVSMQTSYRNADNNILLGIGVTSLPIPNPTGEITIPKPRITFVEPLSIELSLESRNFEFIRDGEDSPWVVADVKWRGEHLKPTFTYNEGQANELEVEYPLPYVDFVAGICSQRNNNDGAMIDNRNVLEGCFKINGHPDVSLSSYRAPVLLNRTSLHIDGSNIHVHECTVDRFGNGQTTNTIVLAGSVSEHSHIITNYRVSTNLSHFHTLRSVAMVQIDPMTNTGLDISINGYVRYDPTNAIPYNNEPNNPEGNRMMFATLDIEGSEETTSELLLNLYVGSDLSSDAFEVLPDTIEDTNFSPTFYTASTVTDTSKGFDIRAYARMSSYITEVSPGVFVTTPEEPVPAGTRINFEILSYKPSKSNESDDLLIVIPDKSRDYLTLLVRASVCYNGNYAVAEKVINIKSNLAWVPGIQEYFSIPTDDSIDIQRALNGTGYLGASAIHDAIRRAAQRLIDFQTKNSSYAAYQKAIVVLTDGDENSSEYTANQAIKNAGYSKNSNYPVVPIVPVRLGYGFNSDNVMLKNYARQTGGQMFHLNNENIIQIIKTINDFVVDDAALCNRGLYTETISFNDVKLAKDVELSAVDIISGTNILYRIRSSEDGIVWGNWTEWLLYDEMYEFSQNLSNLRLKYQVQIELHGNKSFQSPVLNNGSVFRYYDPSITTLFFQPVNLDMKDNEYLSSILITHAATVPATSLIRYGVSSYNSTDVINYSNIHRPMRGANNLNIILSRYKEKMITEDYRTYSPIYGPWNRDATIEVYRIRNNNVELVDAGNYFANAEEGLITFGSIQDSVDIFQFNIYYDSVFRIISEIRNYGIDTASIDHIGAIYNIKRRF